jgi:hypothetical protein
MVQKEGGEREDTNLDGKKERERRGREKKGV